MTATPYHNLPWPMTLFRHLAPALLLFAGAAASAPSVTPETGFSTERAMGHLRILVDSIGPRPMGSPAEHRALEYALRALKDAGCQDTFLMPFTESAGLNTNSGIALGVLKGESGRIILIGGHIDSEGPEVPGADDDGSGAVCVLEAARVLAGRPHHATLLFCLWGGEERGLCGSRYFVDHYPLIDSVRLMLQIDMADGRGPLYADPDGPRQASAPRWLADAAFDIYYNELHYSDLVYPTQFFTMNSAGSGTTGSDHDSFIEAGIPAIDFTSDVAYPIHSPLDKLAYFTPSGLKRAGDLVVRLAERFDAGQPAGTTEQYWLLQVGRVPLFVPHWAITLFTGLAVLATLWMLVVLYKRDRQARTPKVRLSGLKLFGAAVFVSIFIWMSPQLVGLLNGYRFPWAGQFLLFVLLSAIAGALACLLVIRWLSRVGLSGRTGPMFLRAVIAPLPVLLLLAGGGLELAVYFAALLALWTFAVWTRPPWLGFLAVIASLAVAYGLVFNEALGLVQHAIAWQGPTTPGRALLYHLFYVLVSGLLSVPFFYAAAAWYRSVGRDWLRLKRLSRPRGLAAVAALFILSVVLLALKPPSDPEWQPAYRLRQAWNSGDTSGAVHLTGSERLRDAVVHWQGRDTVVSGSHIILPGPSPLPDAWCAVSARDSVVGASDSSLTFLRTLTIRTPLRPVSLTVTYQSVRPFEAQSPLLISAPRNSLSGARPSDRVRQLSFSAFPDTLLSVPVTLTIHKGEKITQSVEATFDTLATPVRFDRRPEFLQTRFVVSRRDSLRPENAGMAEAR